MPPAPMPFPPCIPKKASFLSFFFYSIGPKSSLTARAPYDQFLSTDYEALLQDVDGNVASAETQIPAHVLTGRELLGDITGAAYPASLQRAYRAGRLLEVSASDADWRQPGQQPGYLLAAPTLTAAAWRVVVVEGRTSEAATQNAIARASARLEEHERHLDAGRQRAQQTAARTAAGGAGPSAPRERRQEVQYLEDDDDQLSESSSEEEDEEGRGGGRESRARARSVRHSERLAGRRQPTPERPRRARTADELREQQRAERERRALRRQIAHMQALEQQRRRQERAERSRNGGRLGPDDADDFNLVTSEEEEVRGERAVGYCIIVALVGVRILSFSMPEGSFATSCCLPIMLHPGVSMVALSHFSWPTPSLPSAG